MYKIEQHGKISLRRPKLSKEEVKRLMKKNMKMLAALVKWAQEDVETLYNLLNK